MPGEGCGDDRHGPRHVSIDEHRVAVRRLDEDRVALADVREYDGHSVEGVGRCGGDESDRYEKDRKQQPHVGIHWIGNCRSGTKGVSIYLRINNEREGRSDSRYYLGFLLKISN